MDQVTRLETITIEHRAEVDWLTLNRPQSLNAINAKMTEELGGYFDRLFNTPEVRIVVMRGAGRAFCAGADLKQPDAEASGARGYPFGGGYAVQGAIADIYVKMRRCPQPIISLVHGPACGGGFAFALASDIRIAGESARMNAAFIRVGLSACDMGVSYFLPRLVGASLAAELMLTGQFIHAERALAMGLVSRVAPDDQLEAAAQPLIDDMLFASPLGLRLTKEGLWAAIDAGSLQGAMAIENRNQRLCAHTEEWAEGRNAFMEKRQPVYGTPQPV
jgi:enoyl-CoA hydratase/carnithine racemase